jgi:Cytochrome P450
MLDLSVCIFHILNQPQTLAKLRQEIQSAAGGSFDLPSLATLEQLPYLNATVTEGLRVSYGLASRLPRIRPYDAIQLRSVLKSSSKAGAKGKEVGYVVPPGYAVSMSAVHVHTNPDIFPDPHSFTPERWLDSEGKRRKDLDKYILSFSKGTRQCLGIKYVLPFFPGSMANTGSLAYAEIFICLAALVLRLGDRLELFETTTEDVELHRDVFAVRPKPGTKGIRVLVK